MAKNNEKMSLKEAREMYKKGRELYEHALKFYSEDELKSDRPRSWEEFRRDFPIEKTDYYISGQSNILPVENELVGTTRNINRNNLCVSQSEARAMIALMRLRQLRKAWVKNWNPDWATYGSVYVIVCERGMFCCKQSTDGISHHLSFPTEEMAKSFLDNFKRELADAFPFI